jgi:AcrR family transcriptional regulator
MAASLASASRLTHEERSAQILSVATRLFSRQSYAAVSLQDIADAAGVTRGLLHHYFGTKRDLYLAVVKHITRLPPWPDPAPDGEDTDHVVATYVDMFLDSAERNRVAWLATAGGAGFGRDRALEKIFREIEELYVDRIIEILGRDPKTAPQAQRATFQCYGAFAQAVARDWLTQKRFTREQAHVLLTRTLLDLAHNVVDEVVAAGSARKRTRSAGRGAVA